MLNGDIIFLDSATTVIPNITSTTLSPRLTTNIARTNFSTQFSPPVTEPTSAAMEFIENVNGTGLAKISDDLWSNGQINQSASSSSELFSLIMGAIFLSVIFFFIARWCFVSRMRFMGAIQGFRAPVLPFVIPPVVPPVVVIPHDPPVIQPNENVNAQGNDDQGAHAIEMNVPFPRKLNPKHQLMRD